MVKLGTSVITSQSGRLDPVQMKNLVNQMAGLVEKGYEILLVSSGAIAAGVESLGLKRRPTAMRELQAAASVGQGLLVHQYATLFDKHNFKVGQVLITQYDFTHREHYLNARNTLETLLKMRTIPVINENDTTAVDEIKFGDNDTLAALVANLVEADLLIILTDTEGLYTGDPRRDKEARLLEEVTEITPAIEALGGGVGSQFGSGGMVTKLQAARIVTFASIGMVIANGSRPNVIADVVEGKSVGTFFVPQKKKVSSRKLWIAFGRTPRGKIVVDRGAKEAIISKGKSLLPAGVVDCQGSFKLGDAVSICDESGHIFARGLVNFSAGEVAKIKGMKSSEVSSVLPEAAGEEIIHRDFLVVLEKA